MNPLREMVRLNTGLDPDNPRPDGREAFDQPMTSSVQRMMLARRFIVHLEDGWYWVEATHQSYRCTPVNEGWQRRWYWLRAMAEATWRGFGTLHF